MQPSADRMLQDWRVGLLRGMDSRYLGHSFELMVRTEDNRYRSCRALAKDWLLDNDSLLGKEGTPCGSQLLGGSNKSRQDMGADSWCCWWGSSNQLDTGGLCSLPRPRCCSMHPEGSHDRHDLTSENGGSCTYQFGKARARLHLVSTNGLLGRRGQRCLSLDSSFRLGNRRIGRSW